jgi:hypothetical protein
MSMDNDPSQACKTLPWPSALPLTGELGGALHIMVPMHARASEQASHGAIVPGHARPRRKFSGLISMYISE